VASAADHNEIQYLLLKLGGDMELDVWVARNDRNREYKGKKLGDLSRVVTWERCGKPGAGRRVSAYAVRVAIAALPR